MKNSKLFSKLSAIITALLILCTVNLNAQNELNGYTYLGEMWDPYDETLHYYYLSNCETIWEEANEAAIEMGGYLAIISRLTFENQEVGLWAFNYVNNDDEFGGAWTGLRGVNGIFEWANGEGDGPWWGSEPIYPDGAALIGDRFRNSDFEFPYTTYPLTGEAEYIVEFPFQPNCNNNPNKAFICHNGNTICVNVSALQSHLDHGDLEGPCGPCNTSTMQSLSEETIVTEGHTHQKAKVANLEINEELDIAQKLPTSDQIHIFPNPASDEINVAFPNVIHEGSLRIFSSTGLKIQTIALHGQQSIMIDLSDYTLGIYLIDVRSANGNFQKKFVKL